MTQQPQTATDLDLTRLRAVAEAATPGSWHWAGNTDTGEPYLAARAPGMGASVLAIGWEPRSTSGRAADDVRSYAEESGLDPDEAVDMWANDQYGGPIKEPRLWFYRDHLAVEARAHVRYEVAPDATTREDPSVYRADITDVQLPDAQHIATFDPATVLALLDEINDLRSRIACVEEASSWDRPYDDRIAAIRGMCDLKTNGMAPKAERAPATDEQLALTASGGDA